MRETLEGVEAEAEAETAAEPEPAEPVAPRRETLEGVEEIFDRRAERDTTAIVDHLWATTEELMAKLRARFELARDPSTDDLESYRAAAGEYPAGSLNAYAGGEIDWLVHSWIGNPLRGFTNMHVTAWLGPQIEVPHFGFACGTLPDLWFYVDYVPRSDLMVDTEALDQYYGPLNRQFLEVRADPGLVPFTSKSLYVRQALSHVALCFTTQASGDRLEQIRSLAHDRLDRWLAHVDGAEPTDPDRRAALAAEDLARRRNIAERDPANVMGVRFFGQEMTDRLVRALWGGGRRLPRPDGAAPEAGASEAAADGGGA